MAVNITIPSPGESVTEVTLGQWHKRSGEWVSKDEPLVEIESDKVTLEVVSPETGLLNVKANSGAEMKVGDVIGSVDPSAPRPSGSGNGKADASPPSAGSPSAGSPRAASPSAAPSKPPAAQTAQAKPDPGRSAAAVEVATESAAKATSVARKMAADKGIDLAKVHGTGPSGRVRKSDVLAISKPGNSGGATGVSSVKATAASGTSGTIAPRPSIIATSTAGHRAVRREKMTKLRQRIAERLVAAQHNAAMLTTFNEVDMGEVMRLRTLHKEAFEKRHGIGLGFMSFFIRAAVSGLQQFPRVNAYIIGDEIEFHDFADISVAVGTEKGLVVPVIRNAELLSFADVELTIKDFATRARDGKLTIDEMTGGTFTISNGGVYGSLNSTPILNPPQSGILGMHAIKKRPIEYPANSGKIELRPMMYLALSYDHRIVDGAEAVSFLVHIKNLIENPERMLLGL